MDITELVCSGTTSKLRFILGISRQEASLQFPANGLVHMLGTKSIGLRYRIKFEGS